MRRSLRLQPGGTTRSPYGIYPKECALSGPPTQCRKYPRTIGFGRVVRWAVLRGFVCSTSFLSKSRLTRNTVCSCGSVSDGQGSSFQR